jgi:uncharacterized protein YwqG
MTEPSNPLVKISQIQLDFLESDDECNDVTCTNFGRIPYMPKNFEHPVQDDPKLFMICIVQLNFEQIHLMSRAMNFKYNRNLNLLPKTGIIQICNGSR